MAMQLYEVQFSRTVKEWTIVQVDAPDAKGAITEARAFVKSGEVSWGDSSEPSAPRYEMCSKIDADRT